MKNKLQKTSINRNSAKKLTAYSIPVGTQVIKIPKSIALLVKQQNKPKIVVTRVWIRQTKGKFFLHIGDVESKS